MLPILGLKMWAVAVNQGLYMLTAGEPKFFTLDPIKMLFSLLPVLVVSPVTADDLCLPFACNVISFCSSLIAHIERSSVLRQGLQQLQYYCAPAPTVSLKPVQAFINTAREIYRKIQEGVFDVSNEVSVSGRQGPAAWTPSSRNMLTDLDC